MDYKLKVKELRLKLFLSQTDFAKMLNVSFVSVNRWENGRCQPTMKQKKQLHLLFVKNGIKEE